MKKLLSTLAVAFTLAAIQTHGAARAQSPVADLSQCLAENTSGKDRKDLARWIFFAMAAHPEMKPHVSAAARPAAEATDKDMAGIFTRLLTDSCLAQTQAAYRQGGPVAIQSAFETLGRLAMQELMSNPDVATSMSMFERHLDQKKLSKAFDAGKP